jgi:hypothetical protein
MLLATESHIKKEENYYCFYFGYLEFNYSLIHWLEKFWFPCWNP